MLNGQPVEIYMQVSGGTVFSKKAYFHCFASDEQDGPLVIVEDESGFLDYYSVCLVKVSKLTGGKE